MSLLAQVTTQNVAAGPQGYPPMRLNIQGTDGIGKSTFASKADDVIFLQAEDGPGFLEAARFLKADTWQDLIDQTKSLANEEHPYKTFVLTPRMPPLSLQSNMSVRRTTGTQLRHLVMVRDIPQCENSGCICSMAFRSATRQGT